MTGHPPAPPPRNFAAATPPTLGVRRFHPMSEEAAGDTTPELLPAR